MRQNSFFVLYLPRGWGWRQGRGEGSGADEGGGIVALIYG